MLELPKVVLLLVLLDICSSDPVVQSLKCSLPKGSVKWDTKPELKSVDVRWEYGKYTCHSARSCFQLERSPSDSDANEAADEDVPVQLRPVQIQRGNPLRFSIRRYVDDTFYPDIFKVNASAFHQCDVSAGQVVWTDNGSDVIKVPEKFLDYGYNYFIVADSYKVLISCGIGLRLNVTVKTEECTGNDDCSGRGLCISGNQQPSFACHCCGTYKGDNCSVYDVCLSQPCQNGGECIHSNNVTHNGYQCICAVGYYGDVCENKADNLCDVIDCKNNATCTGNATDFYCACPAGWSGSQCEVDTNDCESEPCLHGRCVDRLNGYECLCYPGYFGQDCRERRKSCTFGPCQNGGFCENQTVADEFEYACHCPPGWTSNDCSVKKSPCAPNPCTGRGFCVEEYNGYTCNCQPGFAGHWCEIDINDCEPNPCLHGGHCLDLPQGHLCRCVKTHFGGNCQNRQPSYYPGLDSIDTHVVIVNKSGSGGTALSVLAGVLTSAVVILIVVLIGCYCRMTQSLRSSCGFRTLFARKSDSDLTVQVNVTNTADCPMVTNSFFEESELKCDLGIDNTAYQTELV